MKKIVSLIAAFLFSHPVSAQEAKQRATDAASEIARASCDGWRRSQSISHPVLPDQIGDHLSLTGMGIAVEGGRCYVNYDLMIDDQDLLERGLEYKPELSRDDVVQVLRSDRYVAKFKNDIMKGYAEKMAGAVGVTPKTTLKLNYTTSGIIPSFSLTFTHEDYRDSEPK